MFRSKPIRKRWDRLRGRAPGWFLTQCRGVIHVGANTGQERDLYAAHGLNVLWIEPIPAIFDDLERNIHGIAGQSAIRALVSNRSGDSVTLHLSNNGGQSSSVLPLGHHTDIWPEVHFVSDLACTTETLPDVLKRAGRDAEEFDALVIDTQGSELAILRGTEDILHFFHFVQVEAADFELYGGYATLDEIDNFMHLHGLEEVHRWRFARHPAGGKCYDVTFGRRHKFLAEKRD